MRERGLESQRAQEPERGRIAAVQRRDEAVDLWAIEAGDSPPVARASRTREHEARLTKTRALL